MLFDAFGMFCMLLLIVLRPRRPQEAPGSAYCSIAQHSAAYYGPGKDQEAQTGHTSSEEGSDMDRGGPRKQNCDRGVQFEGSDMDRGGPRRQNCDRGVQFE